MRSVAFLSSQRSVFVNLIGVPSGRNPPSLRLPPPLPATLSSKSSIEIELQRLSFHYVTIHLLRPLTHRPQLRRG